MSEEIITLGKNNIYSANDQLGINNHLLVVGGSGTGKSYSIVRPNILNCAAAGTSMVISDPKGCLEKEFTSFLIEQGYECSSINLIDVGASECGYNPLDYIFCEQDIVKLAHKIVYDPLTRKSTRIDPYWEKMAELVLSCAIELTIMLEEKGKDTLDRVSYYLSNIQPNGGLTNAIMETVCQEKADSLAARQWKKILAIFPAERTFAGIISSVHEHLARYETAEMKKFFTNSRRLKIETIAKRKSVIFIRTSDCDESLYEFANLIYSQMIESLFRYADRRPCGCCENPVRFILDDFASSVLLDGMHRIISISRSRGISFMLVTQSVSQLISGYGNDETNTIISNCDNIVYFGSNDYTTARYFSEIADVPVNEILWAKRGTIYIFRSGQYPRKDVRYDYTKHPLYNNLKKQQKRKNKVLIERETGIYK